MPTAQAVVGAARRAMFWLPLAAVDSAARHGMWALHNAKTARDAVSRAVAERAELAQLLHLPDDDARQEPGALTVLDEDECMRLLATRSVGRLAYVARAGLADIAPVNYSLAGGSIMIRSGAGPKLQAAERHELVAFEVDDLDEADHSGWSVVVHGRTECLTDPRRGDSAELPKPWASGPRVHTIRITPRRVTGRRIAGLARSSDSAS